MLRRLRPFPQPRQHIRQMKPEELAPKSNRRDFPIREHPVHSADGYHQRFRKRGPGQEAIFGD